MSGATRCCRERHAHDQGGVEDEKEEKKKDYFFLSAVTAVRALPADLRDVDADKTRRRSEGR
jgi:hypothetical protein